MNKQGQQTSLISFMCFLCFCYQGPVICKTPLTHSLVLTLSWLRKYVQPRYITGRVQYQLPLLQLNVQYFLSYDNVRTRPIVSRVLHIIGHVVGDESIQPIT